MTTAVSETTAPIKRTVTGAWLVNTFEHYVQGHVTLTNSVNALSDHGVAKGTISKITTVFEGLSDGKIMLEQVTSLNAAYDAIKHPERATLAQIVALVKKQRAEAKGTDGDEQYVAFWSLLDDLEIALGE